MSHAEHLLGVWASASNINCLKAVLSSVFRQLQHQFTEFRVMFKTLVPKSPETLAPRNDLIGRATEALSRIPVHDENHTVAAAALSQTGEIFVGVNVFHFSGGPCAELVVLGVAAAGGVLASDITTIAAVVRRVGKGPGDKPSISVINPCGRCRQVLLDYNPDIEVILLDDGGNVVTMSVKSLLPNAYVWPDGNAGQGIGGKTELGFV